jgi:cobyrinic acid a,c-diamide synthase
MAHGFLIAAPQSGSGKTVVTLGLLRALLQDGRKVYPAKAGPDFLDPAYLGAATGGECINLDPWAMRPELLLALANTTGDLLVVEAMMGLFDGAADGNGSAADLAVQLGIPVVLVVDAARQSHSIAALVAGFRDFRSDVTIAGTILNKVGSARHESLLREALSLIDMPVLGCIGRQSRLDLPSRHLGLVQAREHAGLEDFLDGAAGVIREAVDIESLLAVAEPVRTSGTQSAPLPLGQRIAVAHDESFAFLYPHLLKGWRDLGAELFPFSPLNDESPHKGCDAVYLPGGYPELHAAVLSENLNFKQGLRDAARSGAFVYGECGGYMVLGEALVDADGNRHEMANLLPLVTSFETRKLHLGYRLAKPISDIPFAQKGAILTAHEFHYSTIVKEGAGARLFSITDARGEDLGTCGLKQDNVVGSYLHLIDYRS